MSKGVLRTIGIAFVVGATIGPSALAQSGATRVVLDSVAEARRQLFSGRHAFDAKQYEAAGDFFARATELNPRDAQAFLWLGNALIHQAFTGSIVSKAMLGPKARNAWERAASLDPRNVEAREYLVSYYSTAPGLVGGDRDKARAIAQQMVALDPYKGRMLLGTLAEQNDDPAAAGESYEIAARLPADSGRAFEGLVVMLETQKKYAEAFSAVDARMAKRPDDVYALYHLGRTAGLSGQRTDDGIAALNRGLTVPVPLSFRFKPSGFHYWLGVLLERKGDLDAAAAQLDSTLKLNPTDRQAKDALERVNSHRRGLPS